MQYSPQNKLTATITQTLREHIEEDLRTQLIEKIPGDTYIDTEDPLLLRDDATPWTIATAILPHTTGEAANHAVYVLECKTKMSRPENVFKSSIPATSVTRYNGVNQNRRVLYVGKASNLIRRIDQHLNSPGKDGANFTGLYRPVRILGVAWYRTSDRAIYAERVAASILDEEFENDFIAYPG